MKAIAAAVLAFVAMLLLTKPIVRTFGSMKVWVLLLLDLLVAVCVLVIVW